MIATKEDIAVWLRTKINCISGKEIDENSNIFSVEYGIRPRNMMYIIFELEQEMGISIMSIFKKADSSIMTVANIANAVDKCKGSS